MGVHNSTFAASSSDYQRIPDGPNGSDHRGIDIQGSASGFVRNILNGGQRLYGVRAIAEEALKNVADFSLENCSNIPEGEKFRLRQISSGDFSRENLRYGKRYIVRQIFIIRAPNNEFNTADNGGASVTSEVDFNVALQASLISDGMQATINSNTNAKVIVVSKSAQDSIDEYINNYWTYKLRVKEIKCCAISCFAIGFIGYAIVSNKINDN